MIKRQAGFTLMELMVVIAIIAILSGIAIPNAITWRNNAQVSSAARGLYSDLQNAKSMAIKENRTCTISFDDSGRGSYTISMANKADKTVNISIYGPVSISNIDFNGASEITFRSDGFAYTNTTPPLLRGGSVDFQGSTNLRVVVTPTGNIRIQGI